MGSEPLPGWDELGRGGGNSGDVSEPSTCSRRGPFVSVSFAVREERPPLMGMRLISSGGRRRGDRGPQPCRTGTGCSICPQCR